MHLLIILRGYHPSTSPREIGGFSWDEKAQAYIWGGRQLTPEEFNAVATGVIERNQNLWAHPVTVRAVISAPSKSLPA